MELAADAAAMQAECRRLTEELEFAERERKLLGYEIHDAVVQELSAAVMLLEGAGAQAQFSSAEAQANFTHGLRLLREGIVEARQLIGRLTQADLGHRGLPIALARLVERFRTERSLPVTFSNQAQDLRLPNSVQHLLLRIAQEALNNAWKHARASEVEVSLARSDNNLELTISDNGVGFEPAGLPPGHFGLEGMRARAHVLGAELLFDTAPNHGTRVVVRMRVP